MPEKSIEVTLTLSDPQLNDDQLHEATDNLRLEIAEVEGVIQADLVPIEQAPPNSKGVGGFLVNVLTAEVSLANLRTVVNFLGDRLYGKTIKFKAEGNGKTLEFEIRRPEDLQAILPQIDDYINR